MPLNNQSPNEQSDKVIDWVRYNSGPKSIIFTTSDAIVTTLHGCINDRYATMLKHEDLVVNIVAQDDEGLYLVPLRYNKRGECRNARPRPLMDDYQRRWYSGYITQALTGESY